MSDQPSKRGNLNRTYSFYSLLILNYYAFVGLLCHSMFRLQPFTTTDLQVVDAYYFQSGRDSVGAVQVERIDVMLIMQSIKF